MRRKSFRKYAKAMTSKRRFYRRAKRMKRLNRALPRRGGFHL